MVPAMLLLYLVAVMLLIAWPSNIVLILAGLSCARALHRRSHDLLRCDVDAQRFP